MFYQQPQQTIILGGVPVAAVAPSVITSAQPLGNDVGVGAEGQDSSSNAEVNYFEYALEINVNN